MQNMLDVFNLAPNLVIDVAGLPAIVVTVERNMETEQVTFQVNTCEGDPILTRNWGRGDCVNVIGVTVDFAPDNIRLFND